ncbi:MAG TPA: acetylglutamate kinase [Bacillota bacterium]|nr:acetylglutamate kinase [Clostridiales bacterium]HPT85899.1 acetylglutamate kinase [Bacillota bacterium]
MFISNMDKARILTQALPYIQKYTGKTVVIKYGGSAMYNPGLNEAVISDIVLLSLVGIHVVLVHGGGPEITDMMKKLGKESRFVNGLRYTDEEDMEIVQMVLAGKTNKDLVNLIGRIGGKAVGLCGIDGGMLKAKKLDDGMSDYGYVGEITSVDVSIIKDTIEKGYIPVIAPIAAGVDDGAAYNINADIAASKLAVALGASNFLLLTDVRGVLRDPKDEDSLIPVVKISEIPQLIAEGIITGGMIPKVNCCAEAIAQGIQRTCILDGRILHSILIEMFSDEGIGTMFVK